MDHRALPADALIVDALIVVDVQSAAVSGARAVPGAARLLDRTTDLIRRARSSGALVVHVQNDGRPGADDEPHTPGWALHHPVEPGLTEAVIRKTRDDGFEGTSLGGLLAESGVRSLAVCGTMSEMCVQATARTALARGTASSCRTTPTRHTTSRQRPGSVRRSRPLRSHGSPHGPWAARPRSPFGPRTSRSRPRLRGPDTALGTSGTAVGAKDLILVAWAVYRKWILSNG